MSGLKRILFSQVNKKLTNRRYTTGTTSMSLRNAPVNRIEIPKVLKVELTDVEDRICVLFDDCTRYLKEEKNITTSCRIAGGWVRDKVNI